MARGEAVEEYSKALKLGQKEYKERLAQGKEPYPQVLSEVAGQAAESSVYVGLVEIPTERIVGTKTAGRISAFTAGFLPLLGADSEFATKWIALCDAHLSDAGIRDPIVCYEYLGNFYVQEGNKRVSVLKYFGAPRIPGIVHRVMPVNVEPSRLRAYQEFLEFYKLTGIYDLQFSQPGGYVKLTRAAGIPLGQPWPEEAQRKFRAYYQYFRDAFAAAKGGKEVDVSAEEVLMLWLELFDYAELGRMSGADLKKSLAKIWDNVVALKQPEPEFHTEPPREKSGSLLSKIISPDYVKVAFVHQRTPAASGWTQAHENGRRYLEAALSRQVETTAYFNANTPEQAEEILEQAIAGGADVIFTTTPQLIAPSLKASVEHPKVKVLNCSVHMPYSTVRTYYSRIYEGKFITGAIAGAMAKNDRIGYVGSYPIYGVPASINAFALGAQLTNPRATIELRWSCQQGNPTQDFLKSGIRVISNRDTPLEDRLIHEYGTYIYNENGNQLPLASPVWVWGKFYEQVIRSIIAGSWEKQGGQAVNYWWGMNSGVIDVKLSDDLPDGVRALAETLRADMRRGMIDPFFRRIWDQEGVLRNDGSRGLSPEELLHMDWLCGNVHGVIPGYGDVLPYSKSMVELLGVFQDEGGKIE